MDISLSKLFLKLCNKYNISQFLNIMYFLMHCKNILIFVSIPKQIYMYVHIYSIKFLNVEYFYRHQLKINSRFYEPREREVIA